MRHRSVVTLIVFMLSLISAPLAAIGQEQPNPVEILIDAFSTPQGRLFAAQFLREPLPGKSTVADETGDFEHSSGQQPGYTPDHIDILSTWALEFDSGPLEEDIFGPTDQSSLWATTGQMTVEPPNHDAYLTFSGDQPHDGSQYDQGAILFGFSLAGTPMPPMPGRCEYVVWINDLSRGPTFANLPAFPGDPAAGTNLAFGLGLNPDDQGPTSTFALEYQKGSGFVSNPAIDVRSFITTDYVGVFVPSGQIGQMSDVNFYTFCMEEGFTFEPEMTGADQTGLIALTSEDLGQLAIVEVVSSTTTTTEPTSSTTSEPATSTTSGSDEDAPTTDGSGFPWWLVMIGGGISVAILGWWLFNQEDDPCRELLEAWMAAQKQCDYLEDLAEQAANDCEEAELELEDLEQERRDACNLWPPACWETEEGASMEDDQGNRITSRDVHMRKMALGDIWDDYKAGKLSALEIEAKWREIDTPEFREELRATDTAAKELVAEIDADIETTRQRADEACERAINSRQKADDACARSDEARKAYEDCVTKAEAISAASTSPSASEDPTSGTATGAGNEPSSTSPQKDPCDGVQPKRRYELVKREAPFPIDVDFSVITSVSSGSGRNVAGGRQLAVTLSDLARDLDFAGDLLNARSAGLHVKGAVNGYASGTYVVTAAGVVKGGIDAATATTDLVPDVPTTPTQAMTEGLESIAKLGSLVATKVTEWMEKNQLMLARLTVFYQHVTASQYRIMECRDGVGWVCVETVWEVEIGKLRSRIGKDREYTVKSNLERYRFNRAVRDLGNVGARNVRDAAVRMMTWRFQHEPGPCE